MQGGSVTSILAVKEPGTVTGDNISVVLYERDSAGVWGGLAWNDEEQAVGVASGVVEAVGGEASLPTIIEALEAAGISTAGPVPGAESAVEGTEFRAGVFADDPLAPFFESGTDGAPEMLGLLVGLGWPAADQLLVPGVDCVGSDGNLTYSIDCLLDTLALGHEALEQGVTTADDPLLGGAADTPVAGACWKSIDKHKPNGWSDWTCVSGWRIGSVTTVGPNKSITYERSVERTQRRLRVWVCWNCDSGSDWQTRTQVGVQTVRHLVGASDPTPSTPPSSALPSNCNPTHRGAVSDFTPDSDPC
jgi:hypothetical protein